MPGSHLSHFRFSCLPSHPSRMRCCHSVFQEAMELRDGVPTQVGSWQGHTLARSLGKLLPWTMLPTDMKPLSPLVPRAQAAASGFLSCFSMTRP